VPAVSECDPEGIESTVADQVLPFEKRLFELQESLDRADSDADRAALEAELDEEVRTVFSRLSAWERVQLARHPNRPRMLDYTSRLFEDFFELHGDRAQGDDTAMVCGIARFEGRTVFVVGQQKGVDTDEKVLRNFGMAHPQGYRKAMRVMKLAERLGYPVITIVDTPAAHPGIEAEQFGQGHAIAQNLLEASRLDTPILSIVLSEGGSGGALAIAVGDWIAMLEYAVYMICPPERCAEILWRDAEKKDQAASALRVTAQDLKDLGVIDSVVPEPRGGAHRDPDAAALAVRMEVSRFLEACDAGEWSLEKRVEKFARMGQWLSD
jgi:acetyl-CoA carboxylase carboxyl transferase subunit alpha